MQEYQQIEKAIAVQESLRGTVEDAILDATIATLRERLTSIRANQPLQVRKQVTMLFMDVVSSTTMAHQLDPEDNLAVMDTALKRLIIPVENHGGRVIHFQGDGFNAIFGHPHAHENDPRMAILAGLGILRAADEYSAELKTKWGIKDFKVRIGINTGLVVIGGETEAEDTMAGTAINLAARLESAAEPGSILISHHTYQHVRGIFDLEPMDPIQVKGFPEPVLVYRVLKAKPRSFRTRRYGVEGIETRMIGRHREISLLQDICTAVIEDGERQVITVVGEAGLGKSRLLYEFEHWIDQQAGSVLVYRGRARLETQRQPYALLRDLFATSFTIQDDDPLQSVHEKILKGFQEILGSGEIAEMKSHILGHILGYDFKESPHLQGIQDDPQQLHLRASVYLTDYFKTAASHQAIVLLLEDLHWADDSSLDALTRLALALDNLPTMMVAATRPTLYERQPHWFEGRAFHIRLDLHPLSKRDSRQLVDEVLQKVENNPEALRELVVSNAEGNPFYVEELIKVLVEDGVIVKGEPHWHVVLDKMAAVHVPTTLTGVLQARLESLPEDERTLLQQASIVGRVFWDQVVIYLNRQGEAILEERVIEDGLGILRGKEMLYQRQPSSFADAQEYVFKHAILREVTYESVLKRQRQKYHELVAEWLMEHNRERLGEVTGLIADHLTLAKKWDEALVYLKQAGEEAARKYANKEAIALFSKYLSLLENLPASAERKQQELTIQFALAHVLWRIKGYAAEEVEKAVSKARELSLQLGDTVQIFDALGWLFSVYLVRGNLALAFDRAREILALAQEHHQPEYLLVGHFAMGGSLTALGNFQGAVEYFTESTSLYDRGLYSPRISLFGADLGVFNRVWSSHAIWHLGDIELALKYTDEGLALARDIAHPMSQVVALAYKALFHQMCGEIKACQEIAQEGFELSSKIGFDYYAKWCAILLAWVQVSENPAERNAELFHQRILDLKLFGTGLRIPYHYCYLAQAYGQLERWDEALHWVDEALALSHKTGETWWDAEVYRLKGEFFSLSGGEAQAARSCLQQAIQITEVQRSKSLELRARETLQKLA